MGNIYVRSTDGSDADNGSTWALAKATITGAAAIDAAGDTIFLSDNHSESTASALTISLAGTLASPTNVICGDDSAEPPTAVAVTAVVATTGANAITVNGNAVIHGLTFSAGSSTNTASIYVGGVDGNCQELINCSLTLANTSTSSVISLGLANAIISQLIRLTNCILTFGRNDGQSVTVRGRVHIRGGSVVKSGFTGPIFKVFSGSGEGSGGLIEGVDMSGLASTVSIVATPQSGGGVSNSGLLIIRDCKLPASWSGTLFDSASHAYIGYRVEMHNCDSAGTNYRLWIEDYSGSIKQETTLVLAGGASDGTTPFSWKMVTSANAKYPLIPLISPEIAMWNDTTGSSKTVTIEILHDSATALKDDEIWVEVQYLGSSATPLGTLVNDAKADVLATAANQTSSSASWTTTGMTNPNTQNLSVTFTPQMKGYFLAKVHLAKASYTVYIDPRLTVS